MEILRKYGLIVLAFAGLMTYAMAPHLQPQLRYVHVCAMILSVFNGRAFIQVQDVKGWFLQNAALVLHAACLVGESILSGAQ